MKKLHIVGLAFAAVFAFFAFSAASAFAVSEWLDGGSTIGSAINVLSEIMLNAGKGLELEDMGVGVEVACLAGTDEGTIGPGAADKITKATCTSLENVKGCEGIDAIEPVNLPWKTELVLIGAEFRDKISNSGAGEPGWLVECLPFGIKADDVCTGSITTSAVNDGTTGTVLTEFDKKSEEESETNIKCSGVFGAGKGLVLAGGDILIFETGLTITVS